MKALYYFRRSFQIPQSYIWGRFYAVRTLYSRYMRLRDRLSGQRLPSLTELPPSAIVQTLGTKAVADLRATALAQGLRIPAAWVEEMRQFAYRAPCTENEVPYPFRYADVKNARLPDGTFVALGYCQDLDQCSAVAKVREDPALHAIVAHYLGYVPRSRDVRLYWAFASDAADDDRRRKKQTIEFHFDVHDYNFCYVHIYLTAADPTTRAHVMVLGSHKSKPLRFLFGSARQPDSAVEDYYGTERVVCLAGEAGLGFIEDTSCYHKALAPRSGDRLLLQIRYH